ncbi:MAG: hypothetical protein E6G09_04355 [Actinobacteria bacterium]|nr:MAG: hypothetical protein E6G18_10340 [Actinomycetota bacterium]TML86228.1 MAG: hypothetical protein E6G09_04355 [Actinomycetota bacterium]
MSPVRSSSTRPSRAPSSICGETSVSAFASAGRSTGSASARTRSKKTLARELDELRRREAAYRHGRPPHELKGKTVILVDDGLATGASMQAAARGVRRHEPARIVISVPVASRATCDQFRDEVDEVVCAVTPAPFYAIGNWYEDFSQTSDEEVRELLERAALSATQASD